MKITEQTDQKLVITQSIQTLLTYIGVSILVITLGLFIYLLSSHTVKSSAVYYLLFMPLIIGIGILLLDSSESFVLDRSNNTVIKTTHRSRLAKPIIQQMPLADVMSVTFTYSDPSRGFSMKRFDNGPLVYIRLMGSTQHLGIVSSANVKSLLPSMNQEKLTETTEYPIALAIANFTKKPLKANFERRAVYDTAQIKDI